MLIAILLRVGLASKKFVRTCIVKRLLQVFSNLSHKVSTQSLNGKLNQPCEETNWLSTRSYEAKADVEVKHKEKRNSDIAFFEINQKFESHPLQQQPTNQWADQAQRDKISLYAELDMKNRLFRVNQTKDCQEIAELRKICCEETDRARQARIDELSMHQERNPTTVSQLLTQI